MKPIPVPERNPMPTHQSLWRWCFMCACLLLVIWTIPHTTALRNIALVLGGAISLWLVITDARLRQTLNNPAMWAFGALLVWVVAHYWFFSMRPDLQQKELTGLWVRVFLALCLGATTAYFLLQHPKFEPWFGLCIAAVVMINLAAFGWRFIQTGYFTVGMMGKPFYKVETVFWGAILTAYAYGNLAYFLRDSDAKTFIKKGAPFCFLIMCAALSAYVSSAKNGILSIGILTLLFLGYALGHWGQSKRKIAALVLLAIAVALVIVAHAKQSPGWSTLFQDAHIAMQIDRFDNWQNMADKGKPPGVTASNTYERVAWITAGARYIVEHPWGFGLINNSFNQLSASLGNSAIQATQTHTGWIDMGLAFGLPGLFLVGFAILYILTRTAFTKSRYAAVAFWTCLAITLLALHSEIFYKQFFEASLFFFAFSATIASHATRQGKI